MYLYILYLLLAVIQTYGKWLFRIYGKQDQHEPAASLPGDDHNNTKLVNASGENDNKIP